MFLHIFVTFLLFLCIFVRLCVALPLWHALAPCMVHGIGMHVMHHIIVVIIIMFIIIMFVIIVDRHVRSSFIVH